MTESIENRGAPVRDFLSRSYRWLKGTTAKPSYALTNALFLRALGVIYVIAFASLAVQMLGLYGSQGILPISDFIARQQPFDLASVWLTPTLFWLNTSDLFIQIVPIVGALLGILLIAGITHRAILISLFVLYLSLVVVGQDFLSFQWDYLLLEVGFIAIFLRDSNLIVWLYRWLLFRLMFVSGVVKLLSGDPNWRNLTALDYHFMTQPLPNIVGWYVYHLPSVVHQFMVAATFFIELVVPFFIFAPRRLRFIAAALMVVLHLQIFLTGNYNFFNLLTIALCILLLDDITLRAHLPARVLALIEPRARSPLRLMYGIANAVAVVLFVLSGFQLFALFGFPTPGVVEIAAELIAPLRVVNTYGPFAVMTTTRPEIVIEGSNDGQNWVEYEFKYKPGDVRRPPPWVEPHQPRLDWQMWFAALGVGTSDPRALLPELRTNPALMFYLESQGVNAWFVNFLVRLLQGSPQVLGLMEKNPFPTAPPRYVRARLYDYRFTDLNAPFTTGEWWARDLRGTYFPQLSLGQ
ncbi:MAG TPA: lipase maturation factor family protein [Anaerolineae bacterium]|nr:lipase maturation factor family protein [Anaerolineae bacterium]